MKKGGSFLTSPICSEPIFTREQFTEEQQEIAKTVVEFAKERILPNKHEIEKFNKYLSLELMRECGELGLLSIDIPEEYDGMGLDKVTSAIVVEHLSHGGCASFATTFGAHTGIGTLPIVFFGNEAQKKKYLPKLGAAEWIAAYALTEPEAGSDATSAKTTAMLSDDGKFYILNGVKQFITNAQWAQVFTVFANVDGDKFTGFIVDRDLPGVSIGPEEKKMGVKGSSTCSVFLENAQVPVENVLGQIGKGAAIAFNSLNIGRFKLGAATLGGCKTVLEKALQYASERRQFGQEIRSFDMLKGYFADMAIRTFALDGIVYRTIGLIEEAISELPHDSENYNKLVAEAIERYAIETSMVKVFGSESLAFVADTGLQIYGGYGFVEDYPMASTVRDNRIDRIWEGSNEINRQIISGYFLKRALMEELPIRECVKNMKITTVSDYIDFENDKLAEPKQAFEIARNTVLYVFNEAICKYGQNLPNHQQLSACLSNMFIDLYVMSSAITRVQQNIESKTLDQTWLLMLEVLCTERVKFIFESAESILACVDEGNNFSESVNKLSSFKRAIKLHTNIFRLKSQIAEKLYD